MSRTVNIVSWDNASGLGRDIDILERALKDLGWTVAFNADHARQKIRTISGRVGHRLRRVVRRTAVGTGVLAPPFDLNLHLEDINAEQLPLARGNILIPNQEWFRDASSRQLDAMDEIWAKTRLAEKLFSALGCNVKYLGWTSVDRSMPGIPRPQTLSALHIAGASVWKGTEALLDVWSENPAWPRLTVLRRPLDNWGFAIPWNRREPCSNVSIVTDRLEDEALRRLQNESAIHVCPSEAEGFGHVIVEGMSVGAVVITTDAPPMNEIITRERGLLAAVERTESMSLGQRYFISRQDLASNIAAVLRMSECERSSLGQAARGWYDANAAAFRRNLRTCLGYASSDVHTAA